MGRHDDIADALPIHRYADEIIAAVRDHRVVILEGPTGSGKTTQLPRILLRAGIGDGIIGVTQPRRIAAVSVAWRIAEELGVELGREVGYAIRFDDRTSEHTLVKVMTDGILLQEARGDADFSQYGVLVIDEAHERSLNIDFVLGLLHRAIQRTDLRVVVSSATIQPEIFQRFFESVAGEVPLISVDARPFPVEIRYRELSEGAEIAEAAAREVARIHRSGEEGHVLVFMPGEGAIHQTIEHLERERLGGQIEMLPLFGRLTREEQERVFEDAGGRRKIIVSTNIAETSLTIDGVRYVIDSGVAKIPRVSTGSGITTLREEPISRASADQRAGRAGRTAPGEAIRLYSARSYRARPDFTDEEINRLDLSDVVLRLIDLGIRDVDAFPFPTPPPTSKLRAALGALEDMGAIDGRRELTAVGRRMVAFPLSPSVSRMIIEAADRYPRAVDDVLVVAAFLSVKSPWLYPAGEEREARAAQERLANSFGDAMTSVDTYRLYQGAKRPESFCERNYLDARTMEFITSVYRQLTEIAAEQGIEPGTGGSPDDVIRSVATGFASNIMHGRGRLYEGPGDTAVALHPSSALFGTRHPFVVACEIMVYHRTYARHVSVVRPTWIPDISPSLARRWKIRSDKRGRDKGLIDPMTVPRSVRIGPVELGVEVVRGRPRVDIPIEVVDALAECEVADVPPVAAQYLARIVDGRQSYAPGTPLALLVGLLRWMPLPQPGEAPSRDVPEGALLEVDRNLHTLGRNLSRVLEPALPTRGRRPGWLALVANGGGAYWYEVSSDFPEALSTTVDALEDLIATVPSYDRVSERAETLLGSLREAQDGVEEAKSAFRDLRKRRR